MIEEVKTTTTEIAEYSEVDAQIALLREQYEGKVYDVTTIKGMDVARRDRAVVRTVRTQVEKIRKAIKAPVLARGRAIETEAKRITGEIIKIEQPIDDLIKAEELRKYEEKDRREKAETKRVEAHQQVILEIQQWPVQIIGKDAADIQEIINELDAEDLSGLEEFTKTAEEFGRAARGVMVAAMQKAQQQEEADKARLLDAEAEQLQLDASREAAERKVAAERAELAAEKEKLKKQQEEVAHREKEDDDRRARKEERRQAAHERSLIESAHAEALLRAKCDSQNTALCEIYVIATSKPDVTSIGRIAVIAEANMEVTDG